MNCSSYAPTERFHMHAQQSHTYIGNCHKQWLGKQLKIYDDSYLGIDLADEEIGLEIKSRWDKYRSNFAVAAYQIDDFPTQYPKQKLFWAFIMYEVTKPLTEWMDEDIEQYIAGREAIILPWNWILQFPRSNPKTGPYVYIHKKDFPCAEECIEVLVEKGKIILPKQTTILESRLAMPF